MGLVQNMSKSDKIYELYDESKKCIESKRYSDAVKVLKEMIGLAEKEYEEKDGKWFSFNHILETYYYVSFMKDASPLQYTEYNISAFYRLYGFSLMKLERYEKAKDAYIQAVKWNPVDLDSYVQMAELYKQMKDLEGVKSVTMNFYNYCCTRETMARFYRNMGYYYLEKDEFETAAALYQYSNIFCYTDSADRELRFIGRAQDKEIPQYDIPVMQKILGENGIPLGPNPDTIGITFRVGQLEMDRDNFESARDCFMMVYNLTQDAETKAYIEKIDEIVNN